MWGAYNKQQYFTSTNAKNRSSKANAGIRELRVGATQSKAAPISPGSGTAEFMMVQLKAKADSILYVRCNG